MCIRTDNVHLSGLGRIIYQSELPLSVLTTFMLYVRLGFQRRLGKGSNLSQGRMIKFS